jgi:DNA-binding CsgD family transcriptional regulator
MGTRGGVTKHAAHDQARALFTQRAWGEAYAAFGAADTVDSLDAGDLERLAIAAYLTGRDDAACTAWARAHRGFVRDGDVLTAVRCAFWLGCTLSLRGQSAPAHGWLVRVQRLVESQDDRSHERGYVDLATGLDTLFSGDPATAQPLLVAAVRAGERHGDPDLAAVGRLGCGQASIMLGRPVEGVAMLDEAMVAVTAEEVSPIATGLIYCAVIATCHELFDLRRAQEWTNALGDWCDGQPDLVPYRGQCLVHRAQLMRLHGSWPAALAEATQAAQRLADPQHPALGAALYEEAELHRLRGDSRAARHGYRRASEYGCSAEPGLALLRLAEGHGRAAAAAIERALSEPQFPAARARLLAAHAEVFLAGGDPRRARHAADELTALSAGFGSPPMLAAMANHAAGAVLLAEDDPPAALRSLRQAWVSWQEIDAPYEAARTRVLIGVACRCLGDDETARMEFDAARRLFVRLDAAPDVCRVDDLLVHRPAPGGLTQREIEVLALVATGSTNRAIAAELVISEKTVARHLSNIYTKLGLSSRAAATAYAYEHALM